MRSDLTGMMVNSGTVEGASMSEITYAACMQMLDNQGLEGVLICGAHLPCKRHPAPLPPVSAHVKQRCDHVGGMMTHDRVLETMAVERYTLGEMPDAERDAFEEHYFGCVVCAADVRDTVALTRAVRDGQSRVPERVSEVLGLPFSVGQYTPLSTEARNRMLAAIRELMEDGAVVFPAHDGLLTDLASRSPDMGDAFAYAMYVRSQLESVKQEEVQPKGIRGIAVSLIRSTRRTLARIFGAMLRAVPGGRTISEWRTQHGQRVHHRLQPPCR